MIWIDPWCWYVWALLALTVPVKWLAASVMSALIHEAGHVLMTVYTGGMIHRLQIRPFGACMEATISSKRNGILSVAAGPVMSCVCVLFHSRFPRFAFCALIQGVFNLLPIYPLDGGRILRYLQESG